MTKSPPAFECRRCGHCCRGTGGIVLAAKDRARLAAHLGMTLDAFTTAFTARKDGKFHLRARKDGFCVFFDAGCAVHPARPDICRAWPYFRGNLLDAASREMSQEYCPGINPGVSHAQFVRQGLLSLRAQGVRTEDDPEAPNALRLDGISAPGQPDQKVPSKTKCE